MTKTLQKVFSSLIILALALAMMPAQSTSAIDIFAEPFADSSQFTTSTPFFSDAGVSSGYDFFGISDGAGGGDFGGDPTPNGVKAYTGFTGSFLTGMDLDGEGATLPITVNWTGIDISGVPSLAFSGEFAEYFDGSGHIDAADYIHIQYQIDGGGYQNLLWFSGADFSSTSGPYNGIFREDTDFDGVGDGAALGNVAQTFVKPISGSGTALDLRLTVSVDAGDEDFAVDNFSIYGTEPVVPDIVINEVDSDTPSYDVLEFIELYDGGVGNTMLDGLVVVFYNGSGDTSYLAFDLDGYATDAQGYFVIGSVADADINVDPGSSGWLQNGADAVAVYAGDGTNFSYGTAVTTDNLIDAFVYDTDDADDAGLLVLLNAGQPQVNENGAGDKDNQSNQRCPNGSGGARNTDTYAQETPTPGAANCVEPLPDIVINEVDSDTPSYDVLEFIELYDGGVGNTMLDGLVVVFYNGSGDTSYLAFDLDGYATDAQGYFVIGSVADADINVDPGSSGWLQNGADAVAVYAGDGTNFS